MRSIIDIIAEQLAIRRTFIKPESLLCKLDADASEVYTILCTIEDTFHIKWGKDKKMAMADVSMITAADIFESVELAIMNYS